VELWQKLLQTTPGKRGRQAIEQWPCAASEGSILCRQEDMEQAMMTKNSATFRAFAAIGLALVGGIGAPANAQHYQQELRHSAAVCQGDGPAVAITVNSIRTATGTIRVQLYRGTEADWLETGRWLNRIELPARAGSMSICMPVPSAGDYAIAIRHDVNGNGETDISTDGGGMSNNPSINIFNLGRPSINRTRFSIGREVKPMAIRMRYF